MSEKIRALMWEEARRGGVLAAGGFAVGFVSMATLCVALGTNPPAMLIQSAFALPMAVLIFLLPFGGFDLTESRSGMPARLLLLPLEVRHLVAALLGIRFAIVTSANTALILTGQGFFTYGPSMALLALVPGAYLVRQGWNWLRPSRSAIAIYAALLIVAITIISLVVGRLPEQWLGSALFSSLLGVVILVGLTAWTYGISVFALNKLRHNEDLSLGLRIPGQGRVRGGKIHLGVHRFRSARTAHLWSYARQHGLTLPFSAIGIAVVATLLYQVTDLTYGIEFAERDVYSEEIQLGPEFIREWGPWLVLLLATALTGIVQGGVSRLTRGLCAGTEHYFPLDSSSLALSRLIVNGAALFVTWLLIAVFGMGTFLLDGEALGWRIYRDAWHAGEVSLREIARAELGFPLLILLVAWLLLAARSRLFLYTAGLALVPVVVAAVSEVQLPALRTMDLRTYFLHFVDLTPSLSFALIVAILAPLASLGWVLRRRLAPVRHGAVSCTIFVFVALVAYPYRLWPYGGVDWFTVAMALAAGSLCTLPYTALLIDIHRARHHSDSPLGFHESVRRPAWNLSPPARVAFASVYVVLFLAGCWIAWPSRPAYVETYRTNGRPVTLGDLAGLLDIDKAVHPADTPYIDLLRRVRTVEGARRAWRETQRRSGAGRRAFSEYDSMLLFGNWQTRRAPVPVATWRFLEQEARQFLPPLIPRAEMQHERKRLTRTVMPLVDHTIMDYTSLDAPEWLDSGHHALATYPLNTLGHEDLAANQVFGLYALVEMYKRDIWMKSLTGKSAEIFDIMGEARAVAEFLRGEPTRGAQIGYLYVVQEMVRAIELAMNRVSLSSEDLEAVLHWFSSVLPPGSECDAVKTAVEHERLFATDNELRMLRSGKPHRTAAQYREYWNGGFARAGRLRLFNSVSGERFYGDSLWRDVFKARNSRYLEISYAASWAGELNAVAVRTRLAVNLLYAAVALERFRMDFRYLPRHLDSLLPRYLSEIPDDPYQDHASISFRIRDDGEFVVYSWGRNKEDDGDDDPEASDDITFAVAPPVVREGPHIVPAGSQSSTRR